MTLISHRTLTMHAIAFCVEDNLLNSLHVWLEEVCKTTSKGRKGVSERAPFDTGMMRQNMSEQHGQIGN